MVLVEMRGRRSGASRVILGSNAGRRRTPAWVYNLRSDPDVLVEHRSTTAPFRAHEAAGAEAERLWAVVIAAYPGYGVYRERTDRSNALFVLEPR